jgi:hypothetical protein
VFLGSYHHQKAFIFNSLSHVKFLLDQHDTHSGIAIGIRNTVEARPIMGGSSSYRVDYKHHPSNFMSSENWKSSFSFTQALFYSLNWKDQFDCQFVVLCSGWLFSTAVAYLLEKI